MWYLSITAFVTFLSAIRHFIAVLIFRTEQPNSLAKFESVVLKLPVSGLAFNRQCTNKPLYKRFLHHSQSKIFLSIFTKLLSFIMTLFFFLICQLVQLCTDKLEHTLYILYTTLYYTNLYWGNRPSTVWQPLGNRLATKIINPVIISQIRVFFLVYSGCITVFANPVIYFPVRYYYHAISHW